MFKKRSDGKNIKTLDPMFKIIPHIMEKRSDSQIFFNLKVELQQIDEYLNHKLKEDIKLTYMDIIYAALVRVIAERPRLNRFVMNGRIYKRNEIYICLAIKKAMSDDAEESIVKIKFKGNENIFEVKQMLNEEIIKNKNTNTKNDTDDIARVLKVLPNFLLKFVVKLLKFLDKHNMMPKEIIKASPFHTSAFLTNVGSIGLDYIYHHLYDFGTTSIFFSMGKKRKRYVYEEEVINENKCIMLGIVVDERICDGFYYASSTKLLQKYLRNPELLENKYEKIEDID